MQPIGFYNLFQHLFVNKAYTVFTKHLLYA